MAKAARIRRVIPEIGMNVMDMWGNRYEVIGISADGQTVRERNLATGFEFEVPAKILGFYFTWMPESC